MSVPVSLDQLETTLAEFGSGYLLTADADGAVKVVTVDPAYDGGELVCGQSKGTRANLDHTSHATMVLWPTTPHGFSLIVDGEAYADEGGIRLRPNAAVLHRPASHARAVGDTAGSPDDCGQDCRPL